MKQVEIDYILSHKEFIKEHLTADVTKLLFRHGTDPGQKLLISQIAARQKIRKKVPEWSQNFELIFLPGLSLEQSSSEQTARLKSTLVSGSHLLDITGGMGIDAFYLSKSFEQTTYVECQSELFEVAQHNLKTLNPHIKTYLEDGVTVLKQSDADVVYADPYRRDHENRKMVSLSDCTPDVTRLLPLLTRPGRISILKVSPMLDISVALSELSNVAEIWIISVRNDCKELLFKLDRNAGEPLTIKTYNLTVNGVQKFNFTRAESHLPPLSDPLKFLYEPNSAIFKGGGQDHLATDFHLAKLHPQSHIFTSNEYYPHFPGRKFETLEVLPAFDKKLKKGRYNVISRNFPEKADKIEKKMKLLSSSEHFLIATKTHREKPVFITAKLL